MKKKVSIGVSVVIVVLLFTHVQDQTQYLPHVNPPVMQERTKATMGEKRENKALAVSYLKALGYNEQQRKCALTLWTRESRFDHLARPRDSSGKPRSSAFGIAQLLRERSGEPELQILHAIRYVEHRYGGSFCSSLRHSDRKGWY